MLAKLCLSAVNDSCVFETFGLWQKNVSNKRQPESQLVYLSPWACQDNSTLCLQSFHVSDKGETVPFTNLSTLNSHKCMHTAKAMTPQANFCSLASVTWHFWHSVFVVEKNQTYFTTNHVWGNWKEKKNKMGVRGRGYEGNWEGTSYIFKLIVNEDCHMVVWSLQRDCFPLWLERDRLKDAIYMQYVLQWLRPKHMCSTKKKSV